MPLENAALPFPPRELRERVSGSTDEAWFDQSGRRTVAEWKRALLSVGARLEDFPAILDFGCGCGRALRHLKNELAPAQRLFAADPDADAIGWVSAAFPDVTAKALAEMPPSPIQSGSIDLVLSHSVFTHLPEDVQFAWLADLRRCMKTGAILIASFHGSKVVAEYLASLEAMKMEPTASHLRAVMKDHGFFHVIGKTGAEELLPSYYGAAFHSMSYIERTWLSEFKLLAWFPVFALDHQDVLVLRKI